MLGAIYLYLLLLHGLLVKITQSVSTASQDNPKRPKYAINLNEPPPPDDNDGVSISQKSKPNQYLSREEIKATFSTCPHKQGCSHWKQMRQSDKDWSRTRRFRYSKPESVRKAEFRKYAKLYKDRLFSDPEKRKAFNEHSKQLAIARFNKLDEQQKEAYLEKRRAITRNSKRKKRDQEIKNSSTRTQE